MQTLMFISSFPIWIPFIRFPFLIAVDRTFNTMFSSSKNGHPCLAPDFRGKAFNFSTLRIMLDVVLSYMALIKLRCVASMLAFWRVYIINGYWILSKAFSAYEIIMWFIFQFFNIVYHTEWSVDIEESWHLWNKVHLVMMCDLFTMLLDFVW